MGSGVGEHMGLSCIECATLQGSLINFIIIDCSEAYWTSGALITKYFCSLAAASVVKRGDIRDKRCSIPKTKGKDRRDTAGQ